MRGDDNQQEGIFSYISPEKRVPTDHPLRPIRQMVDEILNEMSPQFAKLYSSVGRPSIAPERLLRSLLLQIFYSVRSERMLIEQLQYNLLFRWFVGMEMDETVWNHAVFSKNRERLLNEEIAEGFFRRVLERAKPFMSDEHFTVDENGSLDGGMEHHMELENHPVENCKLGSVTKTLNATISYS